MKRHLFICVLLSSVMCYVLPCAGQNEIPDPDPLRFQKDIDTFREWDAKNSYPANAVLFAGSSSIRMWDSHLAFPEYPVINRGFGGSHISDVLYFYDDVIKKYHAEIIILYCGDNDVADCKPVEQVFHDYVKLVQKIMQDNPATIFIYIPIKPSIARWSFWENMNAVNMRIKEYNTKHENYYYLDTATPMLASNGKPLAELFLQDGLHLSKKGYDLWNSLLKSLLKKISTE